MTSAHALDYYEKKWKHIFFSYCDWWWKIDLLHLCHIKTTIHSQQHSNSLKVNKLNKPVQQQRSYPLFSGTNNTAICSYDRFYADRNNNRTGSTLWNVFKTILDYIKLYGIDTRCWCHNNIWHILQPTLVQMIQYTRYVINKT